MTTILNLTQHKASDAQKHEGVFEPANKPLIEELLLFTTIPSKMELHRRAKALANVVAKFENHKGRVMIGGAPYLMPYLEDALIDIGCTPVYAFSLRDSVEEVLDDGTTIKKAVFVHLGFVEA